MIESSDIIAQMRDMAQRSRKLTTGNKVYLGDGAYAEFKGYEIDVTTENGIATTNIVVLEPAALRALVEFARAKGWEL